MVKKIVAALLVVSVFAFGANGAKNTAGMSPKSKKARGMKSIFLIQRGLPHYSGIIKRMWDDKGLNLTKEQKEKLLVVRKETMKALFEIKPKVKELEKKIIALTKEDKKITEIYKDLNKLARLKEEASKAHLKCIEKTKEILTKEQFEYIHQKMKKSRKAKKHKAKP